MRLAPERRIRQFSQHRRRILLPRVPSSVYGIPIRRDSIPRHFTSTTRSTKVERLPSRSFFVACPTRTATFRSSMETTLQDNQVRARGLPPDMESLVHGAADSGVEAPMGTGRLGRPGR